MEVTVQQIWTPAVEAISLQVVWEGRTGWRVVSNVRREGESWEKAQHDLYRNVATEEIPGLVDVILVCALGL